MEPESGDEGECTSDSESESSDEEDKVLKEERLGSFKISKKKKGFMHKLKNTFMKGHGNEDLAEKNVKEEPNDSRKRKQSTEAEETNKKYHPGSSNAKKSRKENSRDSRNARNDAGPSAANSREDRRGNQSKDAKRGKKRFFNFGKRDGKSITFK